MVRVAVPLVRQVVEAAITYADRLRADVQQQIGVLRAATAHDLATASAVVFPVDQRKDGLATVHANIGRTVRYPDSGVFGDRAVSGCSPES